MGYVGSLSGLVNGQKTAVFWLFLGFRTWLILQLIKFVVICAWCIRLITGCTTIKWCFDVGLVCSHWYWRRNGVVGIVIGKETLSFVDLEFWTFARRSETRIDLMKAFVLGFRSTQGLCVRVCNHSARIIFFHQKKIVSIFVSQS
jgi:hypothetical protein